jgi:hypothetical protein
MVGTDDGASDGWPDVLDRPLRSLVSAAEDAVPGGLEGGPGDIRPHDDKAWVKTRLNLLVMQLHPPSLVRPGLYLGTWYNACDLPQLRARGVTHVLNMCGEEHFAPPSTEYAAAGIRCHRCPVTDQPDADISPHLRESMHFLEGCDSASGPAARCLTRCVRSLSGASSSGAALIHCEYGVSRSGTMALAWLMHSEGLSLRDALLSTRAARPQVRTASQSSPSSGHSCSHPAGHACLPVCRCGPIRASGALWSRTSANCGRACRPRCRRKGRCSKAGY